MTVEPESGEPVFRLVYRSRLRLLTRDSRAVLGAIYGKARAKNTELGISGALLVWNESIVQVLEGEEATVRALFATIHDDPRHDSVVVISEGTVAGRVFGRWAMAAVADEGVPDISLLLTRGKARAGPASRPLTTPQQDDLLDELREVLLRSS